MIPVKLTFEGLYAYRESVVIDFTRLCEARLFGIFGPVGSGKSSILEAITFALYGETERMNKHDSRNYNMMNLKSSRVWIDYEFMAGEGGNTQYRFTLELRRNSKKFHDVGAPKRLAYMLVGKDWIPLEHANGAEVLGIGYDHFIKTVIIPQGRFQDFLAMTAGDRTKMLKELFDLQRFDLARPTGALLNANRSALDEVKGKLAEKPAVPDAELQALREALMAQKAALQSAELAQKAATDQVLELNGLKSLIGELQEILDMLELLEQDAPEFAEREQLLKQYVEALRSFKDLLGQEATAYRQLLEEGQAQSRLAGRIAELKLRQQAAEADFETAKLRHDDRGRLQQCIQEMLDMAAMRKLELEALQRRQRLEKGAALVAEKAASMAQAREWIAAAATDLQAQERHQVDIFALNDLRQWLQQRATLELQLTHAQQAMATADKLHSEAEDAYARLLPEGLPHPDIREAALAAEKTALLKQKDHLATHLRLSEFAAALEEGQACPLCGSESHPHPMDARSENASLQRIEGQIADLELLVKDQQQLRMQLSAAMARIEERKAAKLPAIALQEAAEKQLEAHLGGFAWAKMAGKQIPDVEAELTAAKVQSNALAASRKALEDARAQLAKDEQAQQSYTDGIHKLEQEIAGLTGQFQALAGRISLFNYDRDKVQEPAGLEAKAARFKEELEAVDRNYQQADKLRVQLKDQVGQVETDQKLALQREAQARTRLDELDQQVQLRLLESGFADRAAVRAVLSKPLEVAAEEKALTEFREMLAHKRSEYALKHAQVGARTYDKALHMALQAQVSAGEAEIAQLRQAQGRMQLELEHLVEQQARHKELAERFEFLSGRARDLETLAGLFRGDGFVNYVSRVYLKELCQRANLRFQALTRNRLLLELSEDNSFLVRDMVNGGQLRSVKTLSGGQTFQAALSLALALADNVQLKTNSSHNFFFLDEGFGSLDRESLQIVFDTLKALQRENRVVGVISHVEDLQQEIDVHLRVRMDDARGSLVEAV